MPAIFALFYLFLLLVYVTVALFIVFHVVKYSLHEGTMMLALGIFLSVFGALLFSNIMLFLSIKWNSIFSLIGQ